MIFFSYLSKIRNNAGIEIKIRGIRIKNFEVETEEAMTSDTNCIIRPSNVNN